jgi:hypothetical protein
MLPGVDQRLLYAPPDQFAENRRGLHEVRTRAHDVENMHRVTEDCKSERIDGKIG